LHLTGIALSKEKAYDGCRITSISLLWEFIMNRKGVFVTCILALLLLLACNLLPASVATPVPVPTNASSAQETIGQAASATMGIQTQVAKAIQETLAAIITEAAVNTDTPAPTLTASSTLTPSATGTSTLTITPSIPTITVSSDTNCRSGPGQSYVLLGVLHPGETTEVIGQTTLENYWIVRNPDSPTQICWLWGQYATVTGNWQALPVATQPPTPTPPPDFTFSYRSMGVGPGYQCVMFNVAVSGTLSWESYSLGLTNQTHVDTWTTSQDAFVTYDQWCTPTDTHLNLEAGEAGTASVQTTMAYNPYGNQFEATLTLCSGNGMTGTCNTKSITFSP
jgi:hypothetical protein